MSESRTESYLSHSTTFALHPKSSSPEPHHLESNLAAVVGLLPILFEVAKSLELDPLFLCVPAVVAASCGFMLPVATSPNAIVFGAAHIKLGQMVRARLALDLVAMVLIPLFTYLFGSAILGIRM